MTKHLKIYKPFDIIVIPFPFSDKLEQKKRPALVLSSEEFNSKSQHLVTAMITSAKQSKWPFDTPISNKKHAGLPIDCLIRMKFYTADQSVIIRKAGSLSKADQKSFRENFFAVFAQELFVESVRRGLADADEGKVLSTSKIQDRLAKQPKNKKLT